MRNAAAAAAVATSAASEASDATEASVKSAATTGGTGIAQGAGAAVDSKDPAAANVVLATSVAAVGTFGAVATEAAAVEMRLRSLASF